MPVQPEGTPALRAALEESAAVIFDMDGTLLDSELNTERAVASLLQDRGLDDTGLDYKAFYGITWALVVETLAERYPGFDPRGVAEELHRRFHALALAEEPPFIPGAVALIRRLEGRLPLAIGTSSARESVAHLLARPELAGFRPEVVSAEDYARSKPAPDCYLTAAARLGVAPDRCLVFEDSIAGLTAAKAAGMRAVAVLYRCPRREVALQIADFGVEDYRGLVDALGSP